MTTDGWAAGDARLLPMVHGGIDADIPRGSAIMLPDGQMFGRICLSLKPLAF
jgi:hypothetical protein